MMPEQAQLRQQILEAVEALRVRKCRPDRETIAHFVLRKHGAEFNSVFSELENIVDEGDLLKVEYKGTTSYRLPSNFDHKSSPLLTKHSRILNSNRTTRLILTSVSELLNKNPEFNEAGIPIETLKENLLSHEPERFAMEKIGMILDREIGSGNIVLSGTRVFPKDLKNQVFAVKSDPSVKSDKEMKAVKKRELAEKKIPDTRYGIGRKIVAEKVAAAVRKTYEGKDSKEFVLNIDEYEEGKELVTRDPVMKKPNARTPTPTPPGRSVRNKRPREVFDPSDLGPVKKGRRGGIRKSRDDLCEVCKKHSNNKGDDEDFLVCSDCSATYHPSCLDHSKELVEKVKSMKWQCYDCKICYICETLITNVAKAQQIICEKCDTGFHSKCVGGGKDWSCEACGDDSQEEDEEDNAEPDKSPQAKSPVKKDEEGGSAPEKRRIIAKKTAPPVPVKKGRILSGKSNSPVSAPVKMENKTPLKKGPIKPSEEENEEEGLDGAVASWTPTQVEEYFKERGLDEEGFVFRDQEIDGQSLLLMRRQDVIFGLRLRLGPALKVYRAVYELQAKCGGKS